MSVNVVYLLGRLGKDPELRFTPANKPVCNLSLATEKWNKDKNGVRQQRTEWHRLVAWNDLAERCGKYLHKGSKVFVRGELETQSYEKDGIKRSVTQVIAHEVQFLDPAPASTERRGPPPSRPAPEQTSADSGVESLDDMPF